MKKLLLVFCLISLSYYAQTEVKSKLKTVTVFNQNAEINRTASFNFKKGEETIVLSGISTYIIPSSLQVKFNSKNSRLLSAKYERNYLDEKKNNPKVEALQNEMKTIQEEINDLEHQKSSLAGMEQILNKNQDLGASGVGFTPKQVLELSEVYRTKFLEIKREKNLLHKKIVKLSQDKTQLQNQLNEMNASFNKPSGNIVLLIESKTDGNVNFSCSYLVQGAGWSPLYDLRSDGVTENIVLDYKANIYQNTGIDWTDVDMIVSTGNPSQNNNRPVLKPVFASIQQYTNVNNGYGFSLNNQPIATDILAQYEIETEDDMDKEEEINEVIISGKKRSMREKKDLNLPEFKSTAISESQMSIEYVLPSKKSILSDGNLNLMSLKTHHMKTEYIYHSVPKINKGAFLIAKITDWTKYNLIYGQANIFFEGAFVGETYINPNITSDTLLMSMGKDDNITVERKTVEDFTKSKNVGGNKKVTYAYDIILKNKKSVPINIEVLDQVPVSQNDKIEITIDKIGSGIHTEKNGQIKWTYVLEPSASKTEQFMYTVKYPKKESVIGLK